MALAVHERLLPPDTSSQLQLEGIAGFLIGGRTVTIDQLQHRNGEFQGVKLGIIDNLASSALPFTIKGRSNSSNPMWLRVDVQAAVASYRKGSGQLLNRYTLDLAPYNGQITTIIPRISAMHTEITEDSAEVFEATTAGGLVTIHIDRLEDSKWLSRHAAKLY